MKHLEQGSVCPPRGSQPFRLYSMRFCPYAQRARLVLAAKEIPHEIVNIHLRNKPDWYLKKNINGKVPLIEKEDGQTVFESVIVCDYLDDLYPNNRLNPSDPYLRAWDRIILEMFGQAISKYGKILFKQGDPEELTKAVMEDLKLVEEQLANRGTVYFDGNEKPGFLDYMLWPWFESFPSASKAFEVDLNLLESEFPNLIKWQQNMHKDSAVISCMVPANARVAFFATVREGKTNFDIAV